MKLKIILVALVGYVLLGAVCCTQWKKLNVRSAEIERLKNNVWSLNNDITYMCFRDSLRAAEMYALTLNLRELKRLRAEDEKIIKELKLRPKDVVTISKLETITKDSVVYVFRDSCITYQNKWVTFRACLADSVLHYSVRDSIASYICVDYQRKFLWWRWKPRYMVVATSLSPHSYIINGETILLDRH